MLNRRNLLKGIGGVIGAGAVLATDAARAVELKSIKDFRWDETYDVVVCGFGGAGACAAIEACDAGAKVLLLEKTKEGGGNTSVSAGGIMIPKDGKKAREYLAKTFDYARNDKDDKLLDVFVEEIMKQREFLLGLAEGSKMGRYGGAGFPTLPNAEVIDKYTFFYGTQSAGPALFAMYKHGVESRKGITVYYEAPVTRLVMDEGKAVGVIALKGGKSLRVRAKRAVVLATGGYEFNQEMLKNYAKAVDVNGLGCPANTGDGILMAQSAGAKLWHMTSYSCKIGVKVPGKTAWASVAYPKSGIWVDQDGKRFVNETGVDGHTIIYTVDLLDPIRHRYPRIPCYLVFDERARTQDGPVAGETTGWLGYREGYAWSADNAAEVKAGIIKKADTLEELAELIHVDPTTLRETVTKWNEGVKARKDEFGRKLVDKDGKPAGLEIGDGPYYALELYPTLLNTQGGPRKNERGQVLDVYGEPIPRLYAAGEMGSMWGSIYQGACNNAEALVFGRIAGKAAAAEKPIE